MKITIATAALISVETAIAFSSLARAKQAAPSQEAQSSVEPAESVWDGVYTEEQAGRGEALYAQKCARCHGADLTGGEIAPALNSGEFKSNWSGLSVDDLFERIKVSMPQDNPGSLSRQQTADILAFVLFKSGFPAGKTVLAREAEVVKQIRFEESKPEVNGAGQKATPPETVTTTSAVPTALDAQNSNTTSLQARTSLSISGGEGSVKTGEKATPGPNPAANSSLAWYEDNYVSIQIPPTWKIARRKPEFDLDEVQLLRNGFTLTLDNSAGQTSPVSGGRFIEAFGIPWLQGRDVSYTWSCGGYFLQKAQPTNQGLTFYSLIFPSLDPYGREMCGIPPDLPIEGRWFAGYFSTARSFWLFDGQGADCLEKVYILTGPAKTPDKLPLATDPSVNRVIQEAINIVASIDYKRCPPANVEPR